MYFKRIEMHGFKSFAEPVVIDFDRGITCVVGPNGSGKSNISDAIRWVLGEQSPKMLRGGKMEDVIFAGTANRKSRGMAEVTLTIDNSTGFLPIEFQEVDITRRMYRTGESEYLINNSQCRMREIRELLMDTGIGVDGYSLIGQGKISDIISNKTESIREIFEETAGIVSYRSKKISAEKKLKSATSNMERVTDIVFEIEGRIDGLKEDSEKAREYLSLKDKYKNSEVNIILYNIETLDKKTQSIAGDIKELSDNLETSLNEKAQASEALELVKSNINKIEVEASSKQENLIKCINEINQMINANEINKEKLIGIEKNIDRLNIEITELEAKLSTEENNTKDLFEQKDSIEKKHEELADDLEDKLDVFNKLTKNISEKSKSIDDKKNDLFTLHNDLGSVKASKTSIEGLKESLEKRKKELENEQNANTKGELLTKGDLESAEIEKKNIEYGIKEIQCNIDEKTEEEKNLGKEYIRVNEELAKININNTRLESRKKTFEEMENNYDGYNYGVKFIMKSKTQGIFGVVAELITVPKGFEVAMETALGASMQNVVCESDQIAKRAISELKRNKAGRITFLPINSIKTRGIKLDSEIESIDGFKGYGVDIVKCDSKYKTIMEYLLSNVIIVDDMDAAVMASKKNRKGFRIVTLDGEVINSGGAFTGGKYKNKSANILERRTEINEIDKAIKKNNVSEGELQIELAEIKEKQKDLQITMAELRQKHRDTERKMFEQSNIISLIKNNIEEQENSQNKYVSSLKNIEAEKIKSDLSIDEFNSKVEKIENDILEKEEIINIELAELDVANESMSDLNDKITNSRIELNSCQSEKINIEALCHRIENNIFEIKSSIEQKRNEKDNYLLEKKNILNTEYCSDEDIYRKQKEQENIEKEIKIINESKENHSFRENELSKIRNEIDEKIVAYQGQKYELEVKKTKSETQLDNLKDKLWDEFELSFLEAMEYKTKNFVLSQFSSENREIKAKLKKLGDVNIGSIKEYDAIKSRYEFLKKEQLDVQKSMDELNCIIKEMDKIIREKFKKSFDEVEQNFEEIFVNFFGGGHAKIVLDNLENPLEANIEITAQPPGKQLRNINLLSGGEKTMTAIALMFAVLKTKPTPCCILDEVEAALDDHNIHVFANYLKEFDNIQFTLITHQKTTMEHADVMYGVTMPERGISKVFSLKMGDTLPV